MILAAGLGTRLRPWTLRHPKALVPVAGIPMLERVILRLRNEGFSHIVVNVHHFASQIIEFLSSKDFGLKIEISDETGRLLDTGGGVLHARSLLDFDNKPFLIHNVDILSSADLSALMKKHTPGNLATLLVSDRESSRRLVFSSDLTLKAWHNLSHEKWCPEDFRPNSSDKELAFSGIYVLDSGVFDVMSEQGFKNKFPIMDFFLRNVGNGRIKGSYDPHLRLIDIGKPETLSRANSILLSEIHKI